MGPGQTRAMFRGPVHNGGVFLTDESIADLVSGDKGFWDYVDAQVESERIPDQAGALWTWKLSVKFLNQDGTPAVLDAVTGLTSRVTSESYTFHRARKKKTGKGGGLKAVVAALQANQAIVLKVLDSQAKVLEALPALLREATTSAAQAGAQVTQAAAQESAKLLAAGSAPLQQALDLIGSHAKHETARADDATLAHAKQLLKSSDGDWTDTALKLFTAAPAVVTLAQKLKN